MQVIQIRMLLKRLIHCLRHGNFSLERRSENCLIKSAMYATMNTREGVGEMLLGAEMGLNVASQSRKTRLNI